MKAIVYTRYGPPDVLQLQEIARPEPKDNQVLVKVQAASLNALDYRRFESTSLFGRMMEERVIKATGKVIGADIAGKVEAVGANVAQFQVGDEVFGIAAGSLGGFAEYACAAEKALARKPANVSFEAAAAVPVAAMTALQCLRDKCEIRPGHTVLINGASGGVGTFIVQIAKVMGAEVTAVCSARNLEMARSIGADHVVDYAAHNVTQLGRRYDRVVAVNGYHPLLAYRRILNPGGRYIALGGSMAQILQAMLLGPLVSRFGGKQMAFMGISKVDQKDLVALAELLAAGKVNPVIERRYPLSEVAAAVRYLAEGHAKGKVVVQVTQDAPD